MEAINKFETVRRLAEAVGVEVDFEDDHARYGFFKSILEESDWRLSLLSCLLVEPNTDMATSVALDLLERVAPLERDVVVLVAPAVERDRVSTRVKDLGLLEVIRSWSTGGVEDLGPAAGEVLASLMDASDWLQRRVAEESCALPPLLALAEHGRTKKVRARAQINARSISGSGS